MRSSTCCKIPTPISPPPNSQGRRAIWTLPALLAALVAAALFALPAERAGAQLFLPEVSVTSRGDVPEGTNAVFVITASQISATDLTIPLTVTEYPASANVATAADTGSKTVTIAAGQTETTLTVGTEDDSTKEPRGIITAQLSAPGGNAAYLVSQSAGWSTVVVSDNDDALPEVSISAFSNDNTPEGLGNVIFTLTSSPAPPQGITVNVNVVGTGDFGVRTGAYTATIPTNGSTRLSVPLIADRVHEPNGTVTATVQTGDGYTVGSPAASTVNLIDDDTPQVRISAGADVEEGSPATFTVTASPAPYQTLPVKVNVTPSGLSGINDGVKTVNVPTGGSVTLSVATVDNSTHDQGGTITATVQSGSGYGVGSPSSGTVNVADNDGPVVTISGGSAVTEGGDATFTLTAAPAPSNYLSVNVTISAAGEFGVTTGARTVTMPSAGVTTFTVATKDDSVDETDGSVTATVKAGNHYRVGAAATASVAVNDDETDLVTNPVITISGGADIEEGETATFTLTSTPALAPGQSLVVTLKSEVPGHVNADRQETITGGTTTFTQLSDDNNYDEADYSMSFSIKASNDYRVGTPSRASVGITDDDLPQVSIRANKTSIEEDGSVTFGARINPTSYQATTVSVQVAATGDFGVPTGTRQLTVPANTADATFTISPVADHVDENDGSITATINSSSNYEIKGSGTVTVIIKDDDEPSGPKLDIGNAPHKAPAGGTLKFPVTLNQAATGAVSVDYALGTFSPSLWPGEDFQDDDGGISGTVTFAEGEVAKTLNVHIHPNASFEHNDRIYVDLSNIVGGASFANGLPMAWAEGRLTTR